MGVVTSFYRLSEVSFRQLEANPELMDWLLGCSEAIPGNDDKTFFCNGIAPPELNIEQAWDEILIILCRTENKRAYQSLGIPLWEDFDGFEEIRLFSPAQVRGGAEILKDLEIEKVRAEALRRGLQTYSGEPLEDLLDDALGHLETLVKFWRETAEAGEAIVSSTG